MRRTLAAIVAAVTVASGLTACAVGPQPLPREECAVQFADQAPPPPPFGGGPGEGKRAMRIHLEVFALAGTTGTTHICVPFDASVFGQADGLDATVDDGTGAHTLPWNTRRSTPWAADLILIVDNDAHPAPVRWTVDLQATWNPPPAIVEADMPDGVEFGCEVYANAVPQFGPTAKRGTPPSRAILQKGLRSFVRCQSSGIA